MDLFKGYRLEKNSAGYTLILYINENSTEFADFGEICKKEEEKCYDFVRKYVKDNFRGIKITTVKLMIGSVLAATIFLGGVSHTYAEIDTVYTVKKGDSLWKISQMYGVSIDNIKNFNSLTGDSIYPGQELHLSAPSAYIVKTGDTLWKISHSFDVPVDEIKTYNNLSSDVIYTGQKLYLQPSFVYTVQSGDVLWRIAQKFGTSVWNIKTINNLDSDMIYPGQQLKIISEYTIYTVQAGDTLWKIAGDFNTTVEKIMDVNNISSDMLSIGQLLAIPQDEADNSAHPGEQPAPVYQWPDVTYIVQYGDNATKISAKFNVAAGDILRYNYMEPDEWFNAGEKIAISGYAPRTYTVTPGESSIPLSTGKLVDWFTEGQYILKRNDIFTIVDVETERQFKVQMVGGYNHSDIEPLSSSDTQLMKELFGDWEWSPRPVVIFKDGINMAASLSGMPHSFDTISGNNVDGHFDLYLSNSTSHSTTTSRSYIQLHHDAVLRAAER